MASPAELGNDFNSLLRGEVAVDAESVHTQDASSVKKLLQVSKVLRVSAVSDHHATQIDAFFGKDLLLVKPPFQFCVRVGRDGATRFSMGLSARAKHSLDVRGETRLVCCAFYDSGLNSGIGEPTNDVLDKVSSESVSLVDGAPSVIMGKFVKCVKASRTDDLKIDSVRDSLNSWDIATETNRCWIDDGVDAIAF